MSHTNGHELRGWKEYKELLGGVGTAFIVVAALAAILSTIFYCWKIIEIEQITHRSLSPWWTSIILLLPIVIQLLVFLRLRKRIGQAILDDELRAYFTFYFWRMALSLAVYTVLWLCYVAVFALAFGSRIVLILSWLPLLGITLLIGIVIHATYLITKTSFDDHHPLLGESEITTHYDSIRDKLKDNSPTADICTIRKWLRRDRDCKIHLLVSKKQIRDLDIGHLTEALNRLIKNKNFYDEITPSQNGNTRPSEGKLPTEIAFSNLIYIGKHLGIQVERDPINTVKDEKSRAEEEKLLRQQAQRNGLAMFPFYTMVFFFSIFLCIAYLFGFAFAFDDRYVQLSGSKRQVALFMNDDMGEDAEKQSRSSLLTITDFQDVGAFVRQLADSNDPLSSYIRSKLAPATQDLLRNNRESDPVPDAVPDALIYELNELIRREPLFNQHRFERVTLRPETNKLRYQQNLKAEDMVRFNRLLLEDAYPFHIVRSQQLSVPSLPLAIGYRPTDLRKSFYFESGGAGIQVGALNTASDEVKRMAETNKVSLGVLIEQIRRELDDGKKVRIELIGRADDRGVEPSTKAGLAVKGKNTYGSNFEIAVARIRAVHFELERQLTHLLPNKSAEIEWWELPLSNDSTFPALTSLDDSEAARTSPILNGGSSGQEMSNREVTRELLRDLDARVKIQRIDKAWRRKYQDLWTRLTTVAKAGKLNEESLQDIYNLMEDWKDLKTKQNELEAARKLDQIERELYRLEDLSGSQRSVEVLLYSAVPSGEKENPQHKRMALMDYLYFAMYTITTTGYGDIKPVTSYAKFLCTIANIIELFFIVVFFNTLISLKRRTPRPL